MSSWNTACDMLKSVIDDEDEVEKGEGYMETGNPSKVSSFQRWAGKKLGAAVSPPKPTSGLGGKKGAAMEGARSGPFQSLANKTSQRPSRP